MTQEINGIDLSHWDGNVDYLKVKNDPQKIQFVISKVTEGNDYVDPKSDQNIRGAKAVGLHAGAYHYAHFANVENAKKQAEFFWSKVEKYDLDYILGCDIEENKYNLSPSELTDCVIAFLTVLEEKGQFAAFYTGEAFLKEYLEADRLMPRYASWVAHYANQCGVSGVGIWQHAQDGKVEGINARVDMNIAYEDYAAIIYSMKQRKAAPVSKPEQPKKEAPKPAPVHHSIPKPTGHVYSIVNYLSAHHMPYDFNSRRKLAAHFGIHGYSGTAKQNIELIKKLESNTKTLYDTYVVKRGDYLDEIAAHHHVSVDSLVALNHIKHPNEIYVGQKLRLK